MDNKNINPEITDSTEFVNDSPDRIIIKAVGVGGGGNNAVTHMYHQNIKNVSFVNINTDKQALKKSDVPQKLMIGDGLGAGNVPDKARQFAEESADAIGHLFDDDTKMVFITAGMGGGTGTGAAPVVAKIARERGLLTIGIVTIPFLFEGRKKIAKALEGADEMAKYVDALLVINNERLTEIYRDYSFMNAFAKADDTLSIAARSISELITCEGHVNLDFNDVDTTLRNGGAAIISTGYGEGENRVSKAIQDALNSPLLKDRDILGSKKLLFNLYFSRQAENEFKMMEAEELNAFINGIDPEVDVIWGIGFDDTLGDAVKITILAAGFELSVSNEEKTIMQRSNPTGQRQRQHPTPHDNVPERTEVRSDLEKRIRDEYGQSKVDGMEGKRQGYYVLDRNQLDDDVVIEQLENTPTYNRDKKFVDRLRTGSFTGQRGDTKSTPGQINFD